MVLVSDELDGARIISNFKYIAKYESISFFQFFVKEGFTDIIQPFLLFTVSRFTSDPRILFGILGLIFGYFFSRNVWLASELFKNQLNKNSLLYIFLFSIIIPIWEINGFRMWTAAHVLFYGISRYLFTGNKKYYFFIFLTPFIHFSFIFSVFVFFLFIALKNVSLNFIFTLFILSVIVNEINIEVSKYKDYFPEIYQSKIEGYSNKDWIEDMRIMRGEMRWWAKYHKKLLDLFMVISVIITFFLFKKKPKILDNYSLISFFKFSILFSSLTHFFSALPIGDSNRYIIVSNLFLSFSLIIFFGRKIKTIKIPLQLELSVIFIIFYSLVEFRLGLDRIGISTFIANIFNLWFFDDSKPLIVFIKELFIK
ncbi:MAG: hypothetical protein ACK4EX_08855 [Thermaurantimonas sp.]